MYEVIGRALIGVVLPAAVFLGGAFVLSQASGRAHVVMKPAQEPGDRTPLNKRLGYDAEAVRRYWARFGDGLAAEQRFLVLDLVFPLLYGGAFAASLLLAWWSLGRPFSPVWLIAPIAITVLADWTENLVQLAQLGRFVAGRPLQDGWIAVAAAATSIKLVFSIGTAIGLTVLHVVTVVQSLRSS